MNDTDFGGFLGEWRCGATGAHYYHGGKALCGSKDRAGREAWQHLGNGHWRFRRSPCPACRKANAERWRLAGGQEK